MTTFKTYEPDKRKPKSNEEDRLQAACFDHWNKYFRKTSLLFSVPNGQERNYAEAAIAIATGLTAGVADLILLLPDARTVFFELKAAKGTQKKGQKTFEANVLRLRFPYHLIRTFDEFKTHLIALLGQPSEETNRETHSQETDAKEAGKEARNNGQGPRHRSRVEEVGQGNRRRSEGRKSIS